MQPVKNNHFESAQIHQIRSLVKSSSKSARNYLSYHEASSMKVLPLSVINNKLLLACGESCDSELIKFKTGFEAKLAKVDLQILEVAIFNAYHSETERLEEALPKFERSENKLMKLSDLSNYTGEINFLVQRILEYALSTNSSDLHFIPNSQGYNLNIRNSGNILESTNLIFNHDYAKKFISRIKSLSGMNPLLINTPQDGSLKFSHLNSLVNFRISIFPASYGERCVLRVLGGQVLYSFDNLGYQEDLIRTLKNLLLTDLRLILIAGVTGSGKTTLGYSILNFLKDSGKMIITVEDPVESYIPNISQASIDPKNGFNHEVALKTVLRQDPDILYYGEIRDLLSAQSCIQASLTGHSVISTIHAGSVNELVNRLVNLGIPKADLLIKNNLFIHQKLVPKLCFCKNLDYEASEIFGFNIYKPAGCEHCQQTGYSGLLPVLSICLLKENYFPGGDLGEYLNRFLISHEVHRQLLTYLKQGIIVA